MEKIITERAHLCCPGIHFGIAGAVNRSYDRDAVRSAVQQLCDAHPFLHALLGHDGKTDTYFYDITEDSQVRLNLSDTPVTGADDAEVLREYERLTAREWDLRSEGMLKITAWPADGGTCFLFACHHLLADGRGALSLAQEFAGCYANGMQPTAVREKLIVPGQDFPADSKLPWLSSLLVRRANRAWQKEGCGFSYDEYLAFAKEFIARESVTHGITRTPQDEMRTLIDTCHANGYTVNDYLIARMCTEKKTNKVITACDLRSRLACYRPGAQGNYSTAFSVVLKKTPETPAECAKEVHAAVQKIMNTPRQLYLVLQCYAQLTGGLLDAACIACRGSFPSKAAHFIGSTFFGFSEAKGYSVTNLGSMQSDALREALFIPPASPAMRETWGVLTCNGTMTVCRSVRK